MLIISNFKDNNTLDRTFLLKTDICDVILILKEQFDYNHPKSRFMSS